MNSTTNSKKEFDVIIVGAGLAGATLASALAPTGLEIALLDRNAMPNAPSGDYELRVSSLNRGSENILKQTQAWQHIDQSRSHVYQKVAVCQQDSNAILTFDSAEIGEPYMGHMIENANIVHALKKNIASHSNISFIDGINITDLDLNDETSQLVTNHGTLSAKLLVGADGPRSLIRRLAKFEEVQGFYGQKCIVGTVHFKGDHGKTAWQKFLSTGPLGILPLGDGFCSLAWSCETQFADERLAESDADFIASLSSALGGHLGEIIDISTRASYPLTHMHPQRYISQRIALIGDAAHTIHPLAGLGANLGIADAGALAGVMIKKHQQNSFDPGQYETLRAYERWRRPQNQLFLSTMSSLNMVFSENLNSISGLRSFGLQLADRLSPVKNVLMRSAMGLDNNFPSLNQLQP